VDGEFAGDFAKSVEAGEFYTSLARWTAGEQKALGGEMAITQELRNGVNRVQLHLDPNRPGEPFAGHPSVTTLKTRPGEAPREETVSLNWTGPDTLSVEVALDGDEMALSTVTVPGQKPQSLSPVCLPYSPEYAPDIGSGERGLATLERLARATGGTERIELTGLWKDLPRKPRLFGLTPWLLLAAIVCLLLEVFERRTGLVSRSLRQPARLVERIGRKRSRAARTTERKSPPAESPAPVVSTKPSSVPPPEESPQEVAKPSVEPVKQQKPSEVGVLDALKRARERAQGRTDN
jgi:hypothetical protein